MTRPRRVVLGVSGGIAAYKAAEVARGLANAGAEVQAVLTRGAREFVSPMTFAVLSGREVHTEVWGSGNTPGVDHVAGVDAGRGQVRTALVIPVAAGNPRECSNQTAGGDADGATVHGGLLDRSRGASLHHVVFSIDRETGHS